jgi:TM2 domain-containing membrane protein YozV
MRKEVTFGRSNSGNNVVIKDDYASRFHCKIIQDDYGNFTVIDLGSENGTIVNGMKINRNTQVPLRPNDVVKIGYTTLEWQTYFGSKIGQSPTGGANSFDSSKVNMFITMNRKYFNSEEIPAIKERFQRLSNDSWRNVEAVKYKDPTTALVLSIFFGGIGVDRFYIGDIGLGFLKLFTCGGAGIWAVIDLFIIMKLARKRNYEKLSEILP